MPKLLDKLKALPLTVILTVLIWMYAEAQFTATEDNLPLTIHVVAIANDQSIRMLEPQGGQFHLRVEGPQSRVERFRQLALHVADARPDEMGALDFAPPEKLQLGRDNWIDSTVALNSLPYFRRNGLTVTAATPSRLRLEADPLMQLRKPILFRGNVPVKITPDMADLSLPQSLYDTVGEGHITVYARPLRDLDALPRGTPQTIPAQLLVEYPAAPDERVVVNPQQVSVTVTLPVQNSHAVTVPNVPVYVSGPAELLARFDAQIRPQSVPITVAGSEKLLEPIQAALGQGGRTEGDTKIRAYVDLEPGDKASDTFTPRTLRYVYPPGLEIQKSPDHVDFRLVPTAPAPATKP